MEGYIYLVAMGDTNTCKIGFTNLDKKPSGRVKELQTGCPYKLTVLYSFESEYAFKIEGMLHRQYSHKKLDEDYTELRGEWFDLEDKDIDTFLSECEKSDKLIKIILETSTMKNPLKYL